VNQCRLVAAGRWAGMPVAVTPFLEFARGADVPASVHAARQRAFANQATGGLRSGSDDGHQVVDGDGFTHAASSFVTRRSSSSRTFRTYSLLDLPRSFARFAIQRMF